MLTKVSLRKSMKMSFLTGARKHRDRIGGHTSCLLVELILDADPYLLPQTGVPLQQPCQR